MVAVHVSNKNFCFSVKADSRLNHLPLGALAAIKQQQLISSSNCNG
jgi:hypothetical protein